MSHPSKALSTSGGKPKKIDKINEEEVQIAPSQSHDEKKNEEDKERESQSNSPGTLKQHKKKKEKRKSKEDKIENLRRVATQATVVVADPMGKRYTFSELFDKEGSPSRGKSTRNMRSQSIVTFGEHRELDRARRVSNALYGSPSKNVKSIVYTLPSEIWVEIVKFCTPESVRALMCTYTGISSTLYSHLRNYKFSVFSQDETALGILSKLNPLKITSLDFSFCQSLSDKTFQYLTVFTHLRDLTLSHCVKINPETFRCFRELNELERLCIKSCTKVDNNAIREISKISTLKALTVENNGLITRNVFENIVAMSSLTYLKFYHVSKLKDEHIQLLVDLTNLETLKLGVPRKEQAYTTFTKIFPHLVKLTSLHLDNFQAISDKSLNCLPTTLTKLVMYECFTLHAQSVESFSRLGALEEVCLYRCPNLDDECVNLISTSLLNLKKLVLVECRKVTNRSALPLSKINGLRYLDLTQTKVSNSGAKHLSLCPSLDTLILRKCSTFADPGVNSLCKGLTNLTHLDLYASGITDKSIEDIRILKKLVYLNLSYCRHITNEGAKGLGALRNLKELYLYGCLSLDYNQIAKHVAGVTKLAGLFPMKDFKIDED